MKVTRSSIAFLLWVILGLIPSLPGQPSAPRTQVHFASFQDIGSRSGKSMRGSNDDRSVTQRSYAVPDSAGVLPAAFVSATRIESDGTATAPGLGLLVFLAQSDGSIGKGVIYAQNSALSYVAVGDLNRDGKANIVASSWTTGAVEVVLGNGDGTFQAPTSITHPGITNGLVVADLNGDGWPDVAVAGRNSVGCILLNDGTYPI